MKVLQKYPEVQLYWLLNGKGKFPSEEKPSSPPKQKLQKSPSEEIEATFSEKSLQNPDKKIDRIVIFYKDGSFKAYEN